MSELNIKEVFLKKVNHLISNKSENTVTLDLNSFADDTTIQYDNLSLEMTLNDNILTLKGEWDLENISDEYEDEEYECDCEYNESDEDEDEECECDCCCGDDTPCDFYDHRFNKFETFLEDIFENQDDSEIFLATNSLLINQLKLKIKEV